MGVVHGALEAGCEVDDIVNYTILDVCLPYISVFAPLAPLQIVDVSNFYDAGAVGSWAITCIPGRHSLPSHSK